MANLRSIVLNDAEGFGYSAMDNAQVEDNLNKKRYPFRRNLTFTEFQQFLFDSGVVIAVFSAKNDPTNPAYQVAVLADQMLTFGAERLDSGIKLDSPGNIQLFDAMEAAGLISAATRIEMNALADSFESLADINNLGAVTVGQVQAARMI